VTSGVEERTLVLPLASVGAESCLKLSPSGEYGAIWGDGALHVFQPETGEVVAEYPIAGPPSDFVFSECCEPALLIADANAIVYKGLPRLTTFLDEQGSVIDVRYAAYDQEANVLLFVDGPILSFKLSPDEGRLLYTLATSAGTIETRLHSLISGAPLGTIGRSSNFLESYFIDNNTVYYWDPGTAFVFETLRLDEVPALIGDNLSAYCRHRQNRELSLNCF
jgi:hypothetical protein